MYRFFSLLAVLTLFHTNVLNGNNLVQLAEALHALAQKAPQKTCSKQARVDLDWCESCFSKDIRVRYTNHFVEDIKTTFGSTLFTKENPLIYVSVASGELRQDFRILKTLMKTSSIKHLHVFIIDLDYPTCSTIREFNQKNLDRYNQLKDDPIIKKYEEFCEESDDSDAEESTDQDSDYPSFYAAHKTLINEYTRLEEELTGPEEQIPVFNGLVQSLMPDDGSLVVTHRPSIEDYITDTQRDATLKPHCISLTDPASGYGSTNFADQANIIHIKNRFYFAKPYNQRGQLWDTSNDDDAERKEMMSLLSRYKNDQKVSIGAIKTMLDEHGIKNELFSSVFLSMQYLIGQTMRPETIYHRLYYTRMYTQEELHNRKDDFEGVVVTPQKVPNLTLFLKEDEVSPFLKDQICYGDKCVLNRIW